MSNFLVRFGQECLGVFFLCMAVAGGVFLISWCVAGLYYFVTGSFITSPF